MAGVDVGSRDAVGIGSLERGWIEASDFRATSRLVEVLLVELVLGDRRFVLGLIVHCLHSHSGSGHHCPLAHEPGLTPMAL